MIDLKFSKLEQITLTAPTLCVLFKVDLTNIPAMGSHLFQDIRYLTLPHKGQANYVEISFHGRKVSFLTLYIISIECSFETTYL